MDGPGGAGGGGGTGLEGKEPADRGGIRLRGGGGGPGGARPGGIIFFPSRFFNKRHLFRPGAPQEYPVVFLQPAGR